MVDGGWWMVVGGWWMGMVVIVGGCNVKAPEGGSDGEMGMEKIYLLHRVIV